jgi:hydroxymethylpyrimidine/phosphomethylpyrimidine kinase
VRHRKNLPVALTIAGSDSGGGAGIQADLKVFAALGVHGTSAVTCLTAQNPKRVTAVEVCSPKVLRAQIEAVFEELPPAAIKTGMLYSPEVVRTVAQCLRRQSRSRFCPLVVDPVMVATNRAALLKDSALRRLVEELIPQATLLTPNLDEAAVLSGAYPTSLEEMREAARRMQTRFGCAVLVKGGHSRGGKEAVDVLYDGKSEYLLIAPFVRRIPTHGTGCTYSAAITAGLAKGWALERSVRLAKEYVTQAIAQSHTSGRHYVLDFRA